jgi:hypothetical protein
MAEEPSSMREPRVVLNVGPQATLVMVTAGGDTRSFELPLGTTGVSAMFKKDPPRPGELEAAIDATEDALMPLLSSLPADAALYAGDPITTEIAKLAAGSEGREAALAAIENRFSDLVAAAHLGRWTGNFALDGERSAALLILREFMHHGGYASILRAVS